MGEANHVKVGPFHFQGALSLLDRVGPEFQLEPNVVSYSFALSNVAPYHRISTSSKVIFRPWHPGATTYFTYLLPKFFRCKYVSLWARTCLGASTPGWNLCSTAFQQVSAVFSPGFQQYARKQNCWRCGSFQCCTQRSWSWFAMAGGQLWSSESLQVW